MMKAGRAFSRLAAHQPAASGRHDFRALGRRRQSRKNVSPNLVAALKYAKQIGATVGGIVGRDGGYTAKVADACVKVPTVNAAHVTPHTEAFQALVWHLLVSHPKLKAASTKWEGLR